MELRQLSYFVAVAEELHFGRAAQRVHISGPALSQQIIALERELGTDLLVRDRRSVRLSEAGRSLLGDARRILALADDAKQRLQRAAAHRVPVRLGYVSWLPDDLKAIVGSTVELRIDEWVLPSHVQADRVAEGTLDIALAWVTAGQAKQRGLIAHLLCAEPLQAVLPGVNPLRRRKQEFSPMPMSRPGCRVIGSPKSSPPTLVPASSGSTMAASPVTRFYAHVRKIGAPVLASPKRHTAVIPPNLGQRPVAEPVPLWTWSLLHREDDGRVNGTGVVDSLLAIARGHGWLATPAGRWWTPADDPHRVVIGSGGGLP
jgi:DNA-binding transcriptional LysR family regulator